MRRRHPLLDAQLRSTLRADRSIDIERLLALISASYAAADEVAADMARTTSIDDVKALRENVARRTAELKSARFLLESALQNTDQGILIIDDENRIVVFNRRAGELLDIPPALTKPGSPYQGLVDFQNARSEFACVSDGQKKWIGTGNIHNAPVVYERTRADGSVLEIRTRSLEGGGAVRTYSDVTELKRREAAARAAQALHKSLFENAPVAIYRSRMDGQMVAANQEFARIHGYESVEAMLLAQNERQEWRYVESSRRDKFRRKLAKFGLLRDFVSEVEHIATGRRMWTSESAWLVRGPDGKPQFYEGTIADITERKEAERRILHMAMHDALTGLPNRRYLMDWLERSAAQACADRIAILCIDLDRFKEINDTLGHAAGDRTLCLASRQMSAIVGDRGFVVRHGGDEFAVIAPAPGGEPEIMALADEIIAALSEPFELGGRLAEVGASIGVSIGSFDPASPETHLKNADIALYRAKHGGGRRVRLFDFDLDAEHSRRRRIERDLKTALAKGEFSLAYQPIMSSRDGCVTGFEALARWSHPEHGPVSPAEFIPVAEESDLINQIGEFVLRTAAADFATRNPAQGVSVNVSAVQLRQPGFAALVMNILAGTGLSPRRLTLEITETVLLSDNAATRTALKALRGFGVRVSLDDFGAGHSSLSYLRDYEFDQIKIDRSFVDRGQTDRAGAAVVNAVIGLGRDLGIEVIGEGVETPEQLEWLRGIGCGSVQGYLLGKPAPISAWPEPAPPRARPGPPMRLSA